MTVAIMEQRELIHIDPTLPQSGCGGVLVASIMTD
jgi:hypothetical protein